MALQLFKISDITISTPETNIEFTSIPQGYTDLLLAASLRSNTGDNYANTWLRFNGVTGTAYSSKIFYVAAGSITSGDESPTSRSSQLFSNSSNSTANSFGNMTIYIPNYTGNTNKVVSIDYATENNSINVNLGMSTVLFSNTSAITSITLLPYTDKWLANSTATLYGIL